MTEKITLEEALQNDDLKRLQGLEGQDQLNKESI